MLANLSMLHYSGPESNTCNFTFSPQKTFHRLPPALFGSLTYLMIVILHYPLKKISPAPAGITWWSNTCNFTFSPQKKFDRLPPAFFGDLMIVILHYPQKNFRRQTPALFGLLIIVILRSALQKKIWWTKCGRYLAIRWAHQIFLPPLQKFWVGTPPDPPLKIKIRPPLTLRKSWTPPTVLTGAHLWCKDGINKIFL